MAVTKIIFADVSSLAVGGTIVDGANAFQASRPGETRPIYAFGSSDPVVIVTSKGPGNGSFSYAASDGTNSGGDKNWASTLTGTTIVVSGAYYGATGTQVLSFSGCVFGGQSVNMSAKNEMQVNVTFTYTSGTW